MNDKSLKIILTGATGFVGEGVLLETLNHANVEEVLMVNRRHFDLQHPKLRELIVPDFMNPDAVAKHLSGYDACFFCAGISSAGMNELKYSHITYETTMQFAKVLLAYNPDLVFNFVSGSHADSSEKGKVMWARVKGKTENGLMKLPFRKEFNYRPGAMLPSEGQKNVKPFYGFIVRTIAFLSPKRAVTFKEIAYSMVNAVVIGYSKQVLEIADIKELANIN
ncbi:NAD-dependent epimerase/dehydratase family protein [Dyadobacter frigoris]|uniref:NAD-dependent epimerase/dehydratase family protein n=1 Tax=Dyadobacter frigoris TaxID=2576211 RepID=A0A4U6CWJ1_9BACT|nr:NAD-dependent epimerase/dehydratase family protein [Dyadobacter frigoris]TKT88021.1 NAD-dependent epimerase/dehydratase family protein [Dyadobacter frigoris]GLU52920.1 epimerase [Dyadobacter frigoris]